MRVARVKVLVAICACWMAGALAQTPATEARLALLIGNASYARSPLVNSVNDVRLMEATLVKAGFQVLKAENATRRDMQRVIRDFGDRLKQSGGVGLFYFAGHGVQVKGQNFLVPVDSDIRNEDEVAYEAIDAQSVLEKMETARNRVNLLILDACRDNPFARTRSAAAGLATMTAPNGSLVAYATAPGSVASDGRGTNGLYTQHLARLMLTPGLPVEEVFKQVRSAVRRDSTGQQTPWENTALEGQFYFVAPAVAQPEVSREESALWDRAKTSVVPAEVQSYLDKFPKGMFADVAHLRLEALRDVAQQRAAAERSAADRANQERAAIERLAETRKEMDRLNSEREAARGAAQRAAADRAAVDRLAAERLAADKAAAERLAAQAPPTAAPAFPTVQVAIAPQSALPPPAAAATAATLRGTLVIRDTLTNTESRIPVEATPRPGGGTQWTTGDEIASDGQVRAVRIGEWIGQLRSGALWKFPLTAGTSGEAAVSSADVRGTAEVKWKVAKASSGTLTVEAMVTYDQNLGATTGGGIQNTMRGTWIGEYPNGESLPARFTTNIRGYGPGKVMLLLAEVHGAAPAAGLSSGTLVLRDRLTGIERQVKLEQQRGADGSVVWTSGDEIAADGSVRVARIGELLVKPVQGSLWTFPLKVGARGEASLTGFAGTGRGDIKWTVTGTAAAPAIEAQVSFDAGVYNNSNYTMRGNWSASYVEGLMVPVKFSTQMRSGPGGSQDHTQGEVRNLASR